MRDELSKRKQKAKERRKQNPAKQTGITELPYNGPSGFQELSDDDLKDVEGGAGRAEDAGRVLDAGR